MSSGSLLPKVAHQVGLAAWKGCGEPGAVQVLADDHGISRQTVWDLGSEVRDTWLDFEENGGRAGAAYVVTVDRARLVRGTVGTRAETPASLRDIQKIHEHFLGVSVSFGTVQGIVAQAEARSAAVLEDVKLDRIKWISLDEVFLFGEPILVGVDLDTSYLFCLQKSRFRDKLAWSQALERGKRQGLTPTGMVSDSGGGLNAGAQLAFGQLRRHSDIFHAKYACLKVLSHLERRGYSTLEAAEKAEHRRMNPKWGDDRMSLGQKARRADEHAIRAMYVHDTTLEITREVFELMELADLQTGVFREAEAAADRIIELSHQLRGLGHKRCNKLATWLKNQARGLCRWINHVTLALEAITEAPQEAQAVRVLAWLWRLDHELELPCNQYRAAELRRLREQAVQSLHDLDLPEGRLQQLLSKTAQVIEHRHRASSLVECLNSLIRPWLQAHKRVTQGALDLFAAWWNLHPRRYGKLKGSCPHTALTGQKVHDWLSVIGCPPSQAGL